MKVVFLKIKKYLVENKYFILNIILFALMIVLGILRIKIQESVGIEFDEVEKAVYDSKFFVRNPIEFEKYNYAEKLGLIKNR